VFDAAPDAEIGWLTSRVQHLQEQDQMEKQNKTDTSTIKINHQKKQPKKSKPLTTLKIGTQNKHNQPINLD